MSLLLHNSTHEFFQRVESALLYILATDHFQVSIQYFLLHYRYIQSGESSKIARPSMFAVMVKIYGVIYYQASSITFDEKSKAHNFSAFHWSAFRNHEGGTVTEKNRHKLNYRSGPNYRIGPGCAGRAWLQ